MARGVVQWFNQVSDYGYIACDQGGPDRYVRGENIAGAHSMLLAGSRVEFEPREGGMGPEAINVRPFPQYHAGVAAVSSRRVDTGRLIHASAPGILP